MEKRQGGRREGGQRGKKESNTGEESKDHGQRQGQGGGGGRAKKGRQQQAKQQNQSQQSATQSQSSSAHIGTNPFKEMQMRDLERKRNQEKAAAQAAAAASQPEITPSNTEEKVVQQSTTQPLSWKEVPTSPSPQATSEAASQKKIKKQNSATTTSIISNTPTPPAATKQTDRSEETDQFGLVLNQFDKDEILLGSIRKTVSAVVVEGLDHLVSPTVVADAIEHESIGASNQGGKNGRNSFRNNKGRKSKDAESQKYSQISVSVGLIEQNETNPDSYSSPNIESKDSPGGEQQPQQKRTKLNLQCLKAPSNSDLQSQDHPKSTQNRERRRTNSFAIKGQDEKEAIESIKKYNFDFDPDSDSIESFDSTKMTSLPTAETLPPPTFNQHPFLSFEPFQVDLDQDRNGGQDHNMYGNAVSPTRTSQLNNSNMHLSPISKQHSGVQINLQGHGDGLLNYYLQQDELKQQNSFERLFGSENLSQIQKHLIDQQQQQEDSFHALPPQPQPIVHPGHDFKYQLDMPRPWEQGADPSDYFNYQMNEHTFLQFINRQIRHQLQRDRETMLERGGGDRSTSFHNGGHNHSYNHRHQGHHGHHGHGHGHGHYHHHRNNNDHYYQHNQNSYYQGSGRQSQFAPGRSNYQGNNYRGHGGDARDGGGEYGLYQHHEPRGRGNRHHNKHNPY